MLLIKADDEFKYMCTKPNWQCMWELKQIRDIHGHFIDLGGIALFNITKGLNILIWDEIYGNTLTANWTWSTDAIYVIFTVGRQLIVYCHWDLFAIDHTAQKSVAISTLLKFIRIIFKIKYYIFFHYRNEIGWLILASACFNLTKFDNCHARNLNSYGI